MIRERLGKSASLQGLVGKKVVDFEFLYGPGYLMLYFDDKSSLIFDTKSKEGVQISLNKDERPILVLESI